MKKCGFFFNNAYAIHFNIAHEWKNDLQECNNDISHDESV